MKDMDGKSVVSMPQFLKHLRSLAKDLLYSGWGKSPWLIWMSLLLYI